VGPVVAVGRPGEELPLLGAARLYFGDEEWREKVESLISLSQIVIIQAGHTEALEWGLSRAVSMLRPHQLLISFVHLQHLSADVEDHNPGNLSELELLSIKPESAPPEGEDAEAAAVDKQTGYEQFLRKAARVLDAPLPRQVGDTYFWTFDKGRTPVELAPRGRGFLKAKIKSSVEPVIRPGSRGRNFIKQFPT
jgi:hypothetical protein